MQITFSQTPETGPAMGTSSILLCILLLLGALGVTTTSPAQGRLHCYTCIFAKPRYPAPMECQEDEVCGVSIGTSGRTLVQPEFDGHC
uniref:Lymphocyte antigen 6 family member G6E n=1 Tax=Microcebus murinus TaxID=30608 RepID=A0A8C5W1Z4_MICMU